MMPINVASTASCAIFYAHVVVLLRLMIYHSDCEHSFIICVSIHSSVNLSLESDIICLGSINTPIIFELLLLGLELIILALTLVQALDKSQLGEIVREKELKLDTPDREPL